MARAPVSKTGGWGFESLHSCQVGASHRFSRSFWRHMARLSSLDGVAGRQ